MGFVKWLIIAQSYSSKAATGNKTSEFGGHLWESKS